MEKRGRGRPRKVKSGDLAQNTLNLSNNEVRNANNLPEFFKIYLPALSSKMMRIPPDFIDKFGGDIPTSCTLKRPGGGSWQVDTNIIDDDWFFVKGWPEFVQQNSLKDADFLIFSLVGNSLFSVTIFSPNGCLKGGGPSSTDETCESEDSKSENRRRAVKPRNRSVGSTNGNPSFSVELVKSNIDRGFVIVPKEFWYLYMRKNIKEGPTMVTLWYKQNAWHVNLKLECGRVKFSVGCAKFIKDTSLKVGASYTFQLLHTNPFSFKVTHSIPK